MARFFVGQRVRLSRPINHPDREGWEGQIREIHADKGRCFVDWDNGASDGIGEFHRTCTGLDQIDPVYPLRTPVAIADLLSEFPSLSNGLGVSA